MSSRPNQRPVDSLRPLEFQRQFTRSAPGSVLVRMGRTMVLCTCCIENAVPPFLVGQGQGWLTAEYSMLPGSSGTRKPRSTSKPDGRSIEIQRLIGRALRAVVDLSRLGERTLWLDCDVLEADGGTRTASINGAFVALCDALAQQQELGPVSAIVTQSVAAISVGIVAGEVCLDLEYVEDRDAEVDLNLVMTGDGRLIEVQGSGEETTFTRAQLDAMLALGEVGIRQITAAQKRALGTAWPWGEVTPSAI